MELRKTSVDIVPKSICGQPNSNGDIVTEKMICAGYMLGGQDGCQVT